MNEKTSYKTIDGIVYIKDNTTNTVTTLDNLLDQFEAMQHTMRRLKEFEITQHTALSYFETNLIF